jgi:hypothetical protein
MKLPPAARAPAPANDHRRRPPEESGPRRRASTPSPNDFVDYAQAKTEDTTTSQRPADAYEKWLAGQFADRDDRDDREERTTAAEMEPPVRRGGHGSGIRGRGREPSYHDAYRDPMPTAVEVQMDEAPPTMERSEPWDVRVSHEANDSHDDYAPRDFDTDRDYAEPRDDYAPASESYAYANAHREPEPSHDEQQPEYKSGETRMGAPQRGLSRSISAPGLYEQKIPQAPAVPRIATPFSGFNQRSYAPQASAQMPSYERPSPPPQPLALMHQSPSMQMQAMQMQAMQMQQQMQQMQQMQSMQRQMAAQGAVSASSPGRAFPPLLTQVVSTRSGPADAKEVHRAPWFCLGLAVGVISMVVAFFWPSHAESTASTPLPTMQINPPAPQPPAYVQPPAQAVAPSPVPQAPVPQMGQMGQMGVAPAPLPPATQAVAPMPPPQSALSMQKLPTVDVRSLPVAGAKAQPPPPAPRPRYTRPQAPRRPAAPPPKPLPQDDDSDVAPPERLPQAAPKAAPAPAQDSNALAPDTLLQAL